MKLPEEGFIIYNSRYTDCAFGSSVFMDCQEWGAKIYREDAERGTLVEHGLYKAFVLCSAAASDPQEMKVLRD